MSAQINSEDFEDVIIVFVLAYAYASRCSFARTSGVVRSLQFHFWPHIYLTSSQAPHHQVHASPSNHGETRETPALCRRSRRGATFATFVLEGCRGLHPIQRRHRPSCSDFLLGSIGTDPGPDQRWWKRKQRHSCRDYADTHPLIVPSHG